MTVDPEMEDSLKEVITGVSISPRDIEVIRGRSVLFSARITGVNVANRRVHYSISGNTSNGDMACVIDTTQDTTTKEAQ